MGTSSSRSAGTQVTKKGITQGTTLVDPSSGNPVDVIKDVNGVRRIAVDANLTAQVPEINVDVRYTDGDSVAIGDPNTDTTLKIEPDGSINANVVLTAAEDSITVFGPGTSVSVFNSVNSVANSVTTTIATYTVPVSKIANLLRLEVSGTNIAQYDILINNVLQARRRTYFGSSLNETFDFTASTDLGIKLNSGDVVKINVIHQRPDLGDFEGRIQVVEIG